MILRPSWLNAPLLQSIEQIVGGNPQKLAPLGDPHKEFLLFKIDEILTGGLPHDRMTSTV